MRTYRIESTSWVIREKGTGRVMFETDSPSVVAKLNTARYEAVPILEYLQSLNLQRMRRESHDEF